MKNIYDEVVQNKTCIVIGHSMGGAIAVHLAQEAPACGLIVIDVVEGTAIDALPAMEALLRRVFKIRIRPLVITGTTRFMILDFSVDIFRPWSVLAPAVYLAPGFSAVSVRLGPRSRS